MEYSGALRRIAAGCIDVLVLLGIYMVLGFIFAVSLVSKAVSALPVLGLWFFGGMFCLSWIYYASLESSHLQATLGKKLLGLKVATLSGERIGFLRASVRHFSKYLSCLFFDLGFLMIPLTRKKQGLHDKIARTVILK